MGINNMRGPQVSHSWAVGLFASLPGRFGFSGAQVRTHRRTKALRPGLYGWHTQNSAGSARGLRVAETGFHSRQGGEGAETDNEEVVSTARHSVHTSIPFPPIGLTPSLWRSTRPCVYAGTLRGPGPAPASAGLLSTARGRQPGPSWSCPGACGCFLEGKYPQMRPSCERMPSLCRKFPHVSSP